MQKSRQWLTSLLVSITACFISPARAQVGTWQAYMSYQEPQQIVKVGNILFVRASNSLYTYNLDDQSITTYDKIRGMSDTGIKLIAWNSNAQRLLIVYNNSNIDLMDRSGNIVNISSLYSKAMTQDKTVNSIYVYEDYAYLATGFGVTKLNMKQKEITESYILNVNVTNVGISGNNIYAKKDDSSVITASLTANLLDYKVWSATDSYPSSVFDTDNSDWNQYIELVNTLQPGGPKYNYFGFMRFKHGRLYTSGAGYTPGLDLYRPGSVQILKDGEWTILQDNLKEITGYRYIDVDAVEADPADPNHVFAGARSGLYEFQDGQFVQVYNIDNSPLQSAVAPASKEYVFMHAMTYDDNGSLWLFNCSTRDLGNMFELTKDKKWVSHQKELLTNNKKSLKGMRSPFFDSRGYLWFVNKNWEYPSFYCYDPKTDEFVNYVKTIVNQDGTSLPDYSPTCAVEDLEGNVWIGTNKGPYLMDKDNITKKDTYMTQVKVPRNDGTNFADYLLAGVNISSIVIDGGGRKWFGTEGNGIYLISADNIHEIEHFTAENSPLLSNTIEAMAINTATGELFIGTDLGLCSYMTDATTAAGTMSKDNVYAYPNPVVPDYEGPITIVGLSLNADVKIMSSSGKLVAEGRSNGGAFTWDGHDKSGKRVASGIYMVASATSDGKKGTVCKIAFIK